MPEVTSVCVEASTQSSLSCVGELPYMPLYAFELELELLSDDDPGVWTEFVHYDTHTFGPFDQVAEVSLHLYLVAIDDVPVEPPQEFVSQVESGPPQQSNPTTYTFRLINEGENTVENLNFFFDGHTDLSVPEQDPEPATLSSGQYYEFKVYDNFFTFVGSVNCLPSFTADGIDALSYIILLSRTFD